MSNNPTGFLNGITQGIFGGPNANTVAPTINTNPTNAWQGDPAQAAKNQQDEEKAKQLALQTAEGKGPSAATELLKQQTGAAQGAANALASSGSGASGQGIARRNATMAGSNALQTLGGQAATVRAQEQLGGEAAYGNLAAGARGQDLTAAGQQAGLATAQGQISEQNQEANLKAASDNAAANAGTFQTLASIGAGAALLADGDVGGARVGTSIFKEPTTSDPRHAPGAPPPGQEAEWVLREQDNFLMAENKRTGQKFKVAMQHLSPAEEKQVQAPHGAGPIDGPDSQRIHSQMADGVVSDAGVPKQLPQQQMRGPGSPQHGGQRPDQMTPMADGELGGDRFAEMVRRAHPMLYKAATQHYADANVGTGNLAISMPTQPTAVDVERAQSELGTTGEYGYQPFYGQGAPAGGPPSSDSTWARADELAGAHPDLVSGSDSAHITRTAPPADDRVGGLRGAIGGALLGMSGGLSPVLAARMRRGRDDDTRTYHDGDVQMGPVTEEPNTGEVEKERPGPDYKMGASHGRDYEDIKRFQEERDTAREAAEPAMVNRGTGDVGAPIQDPYRNLPQGPALRVGNRSGDFRSVAGEKQKSSFDARLFPRFGEKKQQEWETAEPKHKATETKSKPSAPAPVPAGYSDGDLGRKRIGRPLTPADGDFGPEESPESEETGNETSTARQAFDRDLARTRRELEPDGKGDVVVGRGSKGNPLDIDDPLQVWDYEAKLQRGRDDARDLAWMRSSDPYEAPPEPPRPRLAALFPVKGNDTGPTDWLAALHAKNVAYDNGGEERIAREERKRLAREERTARKRRFGIAPDAVDALIKTWEAEKKAAPRGPENDSREEYGDGDLDPAPRSGIGRKGGRRAA